MQLKKAAQNRIKYGISKVGVVPRARGRDRLGIIDIISCIIELFIRSQFEMTQPNGWNYAIHRARNELWTVGVGPNHDTTNMPRQSRSPAASAWNSNPSWTPAHYDFSAFHVARLIKSCFSSHAQRRSQVASSQHVVSIPPAASSADPHPLAGRFSPVWNPNKARENASRCNDCRGSGGCYPKRGAELSNWLWPHAAD